MFRLGDTFRQLAGTLCWNVIGLLLSLVTGIVTARALMPDGKGALALILTAISLSSLTSALGSNVAIRVLLPRAEATLSDFRKAIQYLLVLAIFSGVIVTLFVGLVVDRRVLEWEYIVALIWLSTISYLSVQIFDAFNASGLNSTSAFLSTFGTFSALVLILTLFLSLDEVSLSGVIYAYALGHTIRFILALVLLRNSEFFGARSDKAAVTKLIRGGLPYLGLNLGQSVTFRSDQFVLAIFRGAYDVGLYAVAATPASTCQVVSNSIGQVVFRKSATGEFTKRRVLAATSMAVGITALFSVFLFILSPWLIPFLFGPAYIESVPLLRLLLVAEVCLAPYLVLSRAAAGFKLVWVASSSGIVGLGAMVTFLFILVPQFGSHGAAMACIISYSIMSAFVAWPVLKLKSSGAQ